MTQLHCVGLVEIYKSSGKSQDNHCKPIQLTGFQISANLVITAGHLIDMFKDEFGLKSTSLKGIYYYPGLASKEVCSKLEFTPENLQADSNHRRLLVKRIIVCDYYI